MNEKLKKLNDALPDPGKKLKQWLPDNYITKPIFRVAVLIILCLCVYGAWKIDFDFSNHYTVSCKATEPIPCMNLFYVCFNEQPHETININASSIAQSYMYDTSGCSSIAKYKNKICSQGLCDKQYLQPGEILGKQKYDLNGILILSFNLIILAFLINHIIYITKPRGN